MPQQEEASQSAGPGANMKTVSHGDEISAGKIVKIPAEILPRSSFQPHWKGAKRPQGPPVAFIAGVSPDPHDHLAFALFPNSDILPGTEHIPSL